MVYCMYTLGTSFEPEKKLLSHFGHNWRVNHAASIDDNSCFFLCCTCTICPPNTFYPMVLFPDESLGFISFFIPSAYFFIIYLPSANLISSTSSLRGNILFPLFPPQPHSLFYFPPFKRFHLNLILYSALLLLNVSP